MLSSVNKIKKLAIFDFCGTLVTFQSADKFVDFVRENEGSQRSIFCEFIRKVLIKFKVFQFTNKFFPNNRFHKKFKLLQIRGLSKNHLENYAKKYVNSVIKDNFIEKIVDELKTKQKLGYRIIILSGGYSIYLKYIADYLNLNEKDIIATDIHFKRNNLCAGTIKGLDCTHRNKIKKLLEVINDIRQYDLDKSYAYSDCNSDLPLLQFVGNGVAVHPNKKVGLIKMVLCK